MFPIGEIISLVDQNNRSLSNDLKFPVHEKKNTDKNIIIFISIFIKIKIYEKILN